MKNKLQTSGIGPFTFKQKCSKRNLEEIPGDNEDSENQEKKGQIKRDQAR